MRRIKPLAVKKANGELLNENIPFFAQSMFLKKLLVDFPKRLSGLKYSTPT